MTMEPDDEGCWTAGESGGVPGGKPVLLVAAAALVDADGRVLLARRPAGKAMAGLWEFPGGKVKPGELPEQALIRELREELGIDTRQSCLAPVARHMTGQEIEIAVDVGVGHGRATIWTCDLTHGYISINADYRS